MRVTGKQHYLSLGRFALLNAALSIVTYFAMVIPVMADIAVTRRDCDRLVEYQQPAGVEYQAGVDSHGEPVVPADIGGGYDIQPPDTVVIPIEILVQDRFGIPANSVLWNAKAQVGVVTVQDGIVYFEGRQLGDAETAALRTLCRERVLGR